MIIRKSHGVSAPGLARRKGLSLLEVLVALAIFLLSLIAISQLVDQGVDMALEMDMRSHAALLAQSTLGKVLSGDLPLTSVGDTPCDGDDSEWTYKIDAEQDATPSLYRVTVTAGKDFRGGRIEVAFSQFVLDPTKRGSTDATSLGTDDTTGSTTGTTTAGTTSK